MYQETFGAIFPAQITGSAFINGIWYFAWFEQTTDPTTGVYSPTVGGRSGSFETSYATEQNNNETPVGIYRDMHFKSIVDGMPVYEFTYDFDIWAVLQQPVPIVTTGSCQGFAYTYQEVQPDGFGGWQILLGGRNGTVGNNPAFEQNGICLSSGTIVKLQHGMSGEYIFSQCCDGNLPVSDCYCNCPGCPYGTTYAWSLTCSNNSCFPSSDTLVVSSGCTWLTAGSATSQGSGSSGTPAFVTIPCFPTTPIPSTLTCTITFLAGTGPLTCTGSQLPATIVMPLTYVAVGGALGGYWVPPSWFQEGAPNVGIMFCCTPGPNQNPQFVFNCAHNQGQGVEALSCTVPGCVGLSGTVSPFNQTGEQPLFDSCLGNMNNKFYCPFTVTIT